MRVNLTIAFFISFFFAFSFPSFHLLYFAPFLVICFYKYSRTQAIWKSIGCGALIDLLSSSPFFGLTSLNYAVTTFLLHPQRRNFFEDKLSTLPLMSLFYSALSTLLQAIFHYFFGSPIKVSFPWIFTDLIGMPICDAFYAFIAFSLPFQLTYKIGKLKAYFNKR